MRTRNAMQLKALINNRAKAAGISPQLMLQDYLYERLLDRLSRSRWRNKVIVKMTSEFKKEMRDYCRDMCITPNALVHLFLGQIAFELRIPFDD